MPRSSRPVCEGHLRLSLVTCPVSLFKATSEGEGVHFHLLHPETHSRVKQAWKDPTLPEGKQEVPRSELLHGYEIEKGKYVVIEDEDIRAIRLESTKTIQIERFVDVNSIDRLYWDTPYYMVPAGRPELLEPFAVIRDAMRQVGRVALGRVVMTGRERIVALEVRGKGFVMTTLHSQDEVRSDADLFGAIPDIKPEPQMVEIAEAIIAKQEGAFDPTQFHDRYAEALRQLVIEKSEGAIAAAPEAPARESNVIDLMDALRRSLGGAEPAAPAPAEKKGPARRTAKAKPAPEPAPKRRAGGGRR
ncbi:MAG: Ku protein [Acetobacteraceae bacterium]|nr:Ku protein [Acetobacteraceae bacterium]